MASRRTRTKTAERGPTVIDLVPTIDTAGDVVWADVRIEHGQLSTIPAEDHTARPTRLSRLPAERMAAAHPTPLNPGRTIT
jgi:hypothetical protein